MAKTSVQIAAFGMGAALLFYIIGTATEYWVTWKLFSANCYVGLWQSCCETTCTKIDLDCDKDSNQNDTNCNNLEAIRAFCVLAILTSLGAFLLQFAVALDKSTRAVNWAIGFSMFAWFSGMVAMAIFVNDPPSGDDIKYGYSFGLIVAGFVISFLSTLLFTYVSTHHHHYHHHHYHYRSQLLTNQMCDLCVMQSRKSRRRFVHFILIESIARGR